MLPEDNDTLESWMQLALAQARKAGLAGEVPVGAVVLCDGKVLGEGYNLRESTSDPTAHAEIVALRQAAGRRGRWYLDDCVLVVTLEPCPMCAGAAVNARLAGLVFGATDPKAGACGTLYNIPEDQRLNHRVPTRGGILADECAGLLTTFFRRRR